MSEEYTQIETPYTNFKWKVLTSRYQQSTIYEVSDFMADFMFPLMEQFPKFDFVASGWTLRSGDTTTRAVEPSKYEVYYNDEKLGEVSSEHKRNGRHYQLTTHRIAKRRQRGYWDSTTKIEVARKIFRKEFRPRNAAELVSRAHEELHGSANGGYSSTRGDFIRLYDRLLSTDRNYVMDNYFQDLVKHAATVRNDSHIVFEKLPEAHEEYRIVKDITECLNAKNGLLVLLHGNEYVVNEGSNTTIYKSEDLPDWIRRKVGMLKIAEDRMFVKHVGYRHDGTNFYITKEQEV